MTRPAPDLSEAAVYGEEQVEHPIAAVPAKGTMASLTDGPIAKTLVQLTVPMTIGLMAAIGLGLIDTFFVGQLGTRYLAAMGFIFPVVLVVNGLSIGLGAGATAVISRAIGEGNQNAVRRYTTDGLTLSLAIVAICVVAGLFTIDPVFTMLGATEDVMPFIREYMNIWYAGMLFIIVPMMGNGAIRATGDMKTPSIIMILNVALNALLDPALIFGWGPFPHMEMAGAATASLISRALTMMISLYVLHGRLRMITWSRVSFREIWQSWKDILYIGLPTAGTNIIRPIGSGVITRFVALYGAEQVAAYGVATRLDAFALVVIMALATSIGPFVGQNLGAKRFDRILKGLQTGQIFALVWGAAMCIVFLIFAEDVARLFNDHPVFVETAALYLRIVPLSYGMIGVVSILGVTLNVFRKPLIAAGLVLVHQFVAYVPLAWVGSRIFGISGIFISFTVTSLLVGSAAYVIMKRILADQIKSGTEG